ncbi:Arylsulfatase [Planctomycetes bacterium CA13]|uniref:Arylsulfatase n=1 Tax=Novipirellula herctigrandis TaxID=2527986 RepID=A0A5C5Z8L2_9BACT|nr:Arylsulfatase [Planctomycetes bacterium CA13]
MTFTIEPVLIFTDLAHQNLTIAASSSHIQINGTPTMQLLFKVTLYTAIVLRIATSVFAEDAPPNVLFIVCDDLNTHVSTSGYEDIHTPTLAAFAEDAMAFERAFCQYPVCGPSRASFLNGLYPESTGVLNNTTDIRQTRPNTVSLPQHFKENGYWTASVGKVFHTSRHDHGEIAWNECQRFDNDELPIVTEAKKRFEAEHGPVDRGGNRGNWRKISKQVMAPLNAQTPPGHGRSGLRDEQHRDGKNAHQVVTWLQEKSYGDKPFFIALGIQKPHVPFLAPDAYFDLYPTDKIQFHRDEPNLWDNIPRDAINGRYREFGFELGKEDELRRQEFMQAYHACVSFVDAQIAKVFAQLKRQGLWENTIIVFTSDHGYHLGDHFLWGKVTLFDIGAKVPFIVRVPGMTQPGSRSDAMVELVDVYPTLSELAGLEAPDHLQGTSIAALLQDPSQSGSKSYAYSVVSRKGGLGYAIRNQKWRYGKWLGGEELYDLTDDPHERHNLANNPEFSARLQELRTTLASKQAKARSKSEL